MRMCRNKSGYCFCINELVLPTNLIEKEKKNYETNGEYSNAIVHAFQKFKAPFSGKIVHIFPEQSAVI